MDLPTGFLGQERLKTVLGLQSDDEVRELGRWGLSKRPSEPGISAERLEQWLKVSTLYPGVFLEEKFAAALVGLSESEFRRRKELFESARTRFDAKLYWKHRLDSIYRAHLGRDTIYGSLLNSHADFAKKLGLRLAPCVVCKEKAVYTACEKCGRLVDPAHCEAIDDGRPMRFRPGEVCFNCIRDHGLDAFRFFRGRRSVRTSVEQVLGPLSKS
jgi:hypothetical protein